MVRPRRRGSDAGGGGIASQDTLDLSAVLASLGLQNASRVEAVVGGADAALWRVEHAEKVYVLRVFPPGRTIDREIAAMTAAASAGIPVPRVYRTEMWQNRPIMLLSWIGGQPLARAFQNHPWQVWRLGVAFGQMQAAIHAVPYDANPTDWIEGAGPQEQPLKDRLYALTPRKSALLHLDYHLQNVMTDGTRITGVLDWANALSGDPRADFARTYAILHVEPWSPQPLPLHMRLFRGILGRAWQHGYAQTLGDMALFFAWAGVVMIRDLSPRIGQPGFWLQSHHLDPVRRWTALWKLRAGI